jgi:hypothetical protein
VHARYFRGISMEVSRKLPSCGMPLSQDCPESFVVRNIGTNSNLGKYADRADNYSSRDSVRRKGQCNTLPNRTMVQ